MQQLVDQSADGRGTLQGCRLFCAEWFVSLIVCRGQGTLEGYGPILAPLPLAAPPVETPYWDYLKSQSVEIKVVHSRPKGNINSMAKPLDFSGSSQELHEFSDSCRVLKGPKPYGTLLLQVSRQNRNTAKGFSPSSPHPCLPIQCLALMSPVPQP